MKYEESAESKEKSNFRFFRFLFFEYGHFLTIFVTSYPQFLMNFRITRKIKIGKTGKLFFIRFSTFCLIHKNLIKTERWGFCITLVWKYPNFSCYASLKLILLYDINQLQVGDMKKYVMKKWGTVLKWLGTTVLG